MKNWVRRASLRMDPSGSSKAKETEDFILVIFSGVRTQAGSWVSLSLEMKGISLSEARRSPLEKTGPEGYSQARTPARTSLDQWVSRCHAVDVKCVLVKRVLHLGFGRRLCFGLFQLFVGVG